MNTAVLPSKFWYSESTRVGYTSDLCPSTLGTNLLNSWNLSAASSAEIRPFHQAQHKNSLAGLVTITRRSVEDSNDLRDPCHFLLFWPGRRRSKNDIPRYTRAAWRVRGDYTLCSTLIPSSSLYIIKAIYSTRCALCPLTWLRRSYLGFC